MRRYAGTEASLRAIRDVRARAASGITTDGNGLYDRQMTPDEFARRVAADIRKDGDRAIARITAALDGAAPESLEVPRSTIERAVKKIRPETRRAIELAVERVTTFQKTAMPQSWRSEDGQYGEEVTPLGRAGVYVPGGAAPLASSVIMTVVPAKVAGVDEIVLATPGRAGSDPHEAVLAAAAIAGADRVFNIGGAQAIVAMAYGTESVPACDIVAGPGNVFTTAAKRVVFGDTGVDGLYGPTETAIIADHSADPVYAAADLLAQAEHDTAALPVLISLGEQVAARIESEVERQIQKLPRAAIAAKALENGLSLVVERADEAIKLANALAPEHLCIALENAAQYLPAVRYAGGIFLGEFSTEVMADYVAGPSHVMPTGGTARFASALSVRNFVRITPVLDFSREQFLELSLDAAILARAEGLDGHAAAVELRREKLVGE